MASMNETGRLTLPSSTRQELGIEGPAEFEVEVERGRVVLKPAVVLPLEDAWAYTPEHRGLLKKAHADSRMGRVSKLSEKELLKLGPNS